MKKFSKEVLAAMLCAVMLCMGLMSYTAAADELDMSETVKIGVLVADATGAEALGFRSYYENYIQNQYNSRICLFG